MKSHKKSLFFFMVTLLAFSAIRIELLTRLNAQPSLLHLSLAATVKNDATAPVIVTWCSDNSGGNPTGPGGKDMPSIAFTPDRTMYSFAVMDINDKSIMYRVFDQDNNLIDRFIILKDRYN